MAKVKEDFKRLWQKLYNRYSVAFVNVYSLLCIMYLSALIVMCIVTGSGALAFGLIFASAFIFILNIFVGAIFFIIFLVESKMKFFIEDNSIVTSEAYMYFSIFSLLAVLLSDLFWILVALS